MSKQLSGVLKKVQSQLEEWENLGAKVTLLNLSNHCFYDSKLNYISGKTPRILKRKFKGFVVVCKNALHLFYVFCK